MLLHVCIEKINHLTKLEKYGNPVILVNEKKKKSVIFFFIKYLLSAICMRKNKGKI